MTEGCVASDPCDVEDSAEAFLCGAEVEATLGTGEDTFEALVDGVLPLHRGTQGLQHVLVSARAPLAPGPVGRATVRLSVWVEGSTDPVVGPLEVGLAAREEGDGLLIPGILVVVEEPERVLEQEVLVTVSLQPVGGEAEARGVLEAVVRWADQPLP